MTSRLPDLLTVAHVARLAAVGRALQTRLATPRVRRVRLVDVLALGPGNRLAVVEFGGRELLLSVTKNATTLVAEHSQLAEYGA